MNNCTQPSCPCGNQDIEESVEQIKKSMNWNTQESDSANFIAIFTLEALILGVIVAMILANIPTSVN